MTALEHARRHKRPRYNPVAPNRGGAQPDPQRAERPHPNWCDCPNCAPPGPADRGLGCAILSFLIPFSIGGIAVGAGIGVVYLVGGSAGVTLIFGSVL